MARESALHSVSTAALVASNVIPSRRKVATESWADAFEVLDLFNPGDVPLNRVTGGFNAAVQVAAAYSLRSYTQQVGQIRVVATRSSNRMQTDLTPILSKITDPWWTTATLDPGLDYGIGVELTPASLTYSDPRNATITLRGTIGLYVEAIVIDPAHVPDRRAFAEPFGDPPIDVFAGGPGRQPSAGSEGMPLMTRRAGSTMRAAGRAPNTAAGAAMGDLVEAAWGAPEREQAMRLLHAIGDIQVTVTAPYDSTEHGPQRSVDVWMNMGEATIVVAPAAGDAKLFYETFLTTRVGTLAARLAPVAQMPLTPTVSLAGRNPANSRIDEFTEFETRVFHVIERDRHAICVAFDVVPGCKGIIENVRHFIGGSDYGVVHDEYVVERVLRHKWNAGGFDRSMALANHVSLKVQRNGRDSTEDAMVYGRLVLHTLDVIALVPNADSRGDVLALGGQAQAVADRVVLADGNVLTPGNADLGPAQDTGWAVNIAPAISTPWEPDAELRDFKNQAHRDGIRHLARPFARFPEGYGFPEVQYTRTEAVQKRLFFLGRLPIVFS
jgi:hypothetical protein